MIRAPNRTERPPVKTRLIASADPERLETWVRYSAGLCRDCHATCCTLPVEVRIDDLIRLELVDAFERDEPAKNIAKRLSKAGIVLDRKQLADLAINDPAAFSQLAELAAQNQ